MSVSQDTGKHRSVPQRQPHDVHGGQSDPDPASSRPLRNEVASRPEAKGPGQSEHGEQGNRRHKVLLVEHSLTFIHLLNRSQQIWKSPPGLGAVTSGQRWAAREGPPVPSNAHALTADAPLLQFLDETPVGRDRLAERDTRFLVVRRAWRNTTRLGFVLCSQKTQARGRELGSHRGGNLTQVLLSGPGLTGRSRSRELSTIISCCPSEPAPTGTLSPGHLRPASERPVVGHLPAGHQPP